MRAPLGAAALALALAGPLAAQATGTVSGRVRDAATGQALPGVQVTVDDRQGATTDTAGRYRIREVRSGWHRLRAALIGYRPAARDSIQVQGGSGVIVDFALVPQAVEMPPLAVEAVSDPVLDPLVTATVQRITRDELRALPVTSVAEAIELSAGAVGESYRGGRLGQQAFVLDGLGVKNRLDASTAQLGLRLPADLVSEATLVTNGFSARYGQALSGLISVNTRDAGDRWAGRVAYETDRPLAEGGDLGIDRVVASAEGPVSGAIGVVAALDAEARIDADPVRAPPPPDPHDPRVQNPSLLPHNSGERVDLGAKLTALMGTRHALRVFGLVSSEQRLLFDPAYKYDEPLGPGLRVRGDLLSAHLQRAASPEARTPVTLDLRLAYVGREFARGALEQQPDYRFGAFTFDRFRFMGEDLARALDTAGARASVPGFTPPDWSERTAWGVPAFFTGFGPRGEIAWNRLRELRGQLDLVVGLGTEADLFVGGEISRQQVQSFHRVRASLPVGDTVPPASAAEFTPLAAALYAETQLRISDLAFTIGLRYDQFDPRSDLGDSAGTTKPRRTLNPRFAVSTVLQGATFVASWGRFSQAPDYQYLVDAAFDDTARTGRFRRGNPNLGYETATQYEFNLRARPGPATSLRVGVFVKRLEGLVASVPLGVDPDSSIFGNADFGSVKGVEIVFERELKDWWGARLAYALQQATATASTASKFFQQFIEIDPQTGDTITPARVEIPLDYDRRHAVVAIGQLRVPDGIGPAIAGASLLGGLELAGVLRVSTGLPYTRTNRTGDTLIGLPNRWRLPTQSTIDLLLRRPVSLSRLRGSLYLDVRNLLNRRNVESVRRESGAPQLTTGDLAARAESAYVQHPEAIPYESPRYRAWADLDGNGLIQGRAELFPLYLAAARDFYQPLFGYGPPRLVRLGVELMF
ncbi:MAG: TonB-dependent receptor [Gemmatimonadales bacterium]